MPHQNDPIQPLYPKMVLADGIHLCLGLRTILVPQNNADNVCVSQSVILYTSAFIAHASVFVTCFMLFAACKHACLLSAFNLA